MRRTFALAALILLLFALYRQDYGQRVFKQVALPLRIVLLSLAKPDADLPVPVRGIRPQEVKGTWRASRSGGRQHEGEDIFAPRGTPVVSATRGVVVRVGPNNLGGNTISIIGPGGRLYYYAHLSAYEADIERGDTVFSGQIIGYVGNTGNAASTPAHLHFAIYSPRGVVDPLPLMKRALEALPPGRSE